MKSTSLFSSLSLLLTLQELSCVTGGGHEDLPGHLEPLGSHMPPELVRRISHLPSPREFHENYVTPKTPVIIEGALRSSKVWKDWQDDDYIRLLDMHGLGFDEGKSVSLVYTHTTFFFISSGGILGRS